MNAARHENSMHLNFTEYPFGRVVERPLLADSGHLTIAAKSIFDTNITIRQTSLASRMQSVSEKNKL
jgi:hypothetical protein